MEISQKRSALEQSLIPDTPESHESRLETIGYQPVTRVFQALNFIAWVAWKRQMLDVTVLQQQLIACQQPDWAENLPNELELLLKKK